MTTNSGGWKDWPRPLRNHAHAASEHEKTWLLRRVLLHSYGGRELYVDPEQETPRKNEERQ